MKLYSYDDDLLAECILDARIALIAPESDQYAGPQVAISRGCVWVFVCVD